MLDPVLLVVYALAVTRVVGLVVDDDLTEGLRHGFIGWLDDRPKTLGSYVARLVTCYWCAGIWVSAVAAPLIWWHGRNPWLAIPALMLALSQVAGMLSKIGR